jgi:hypothetical protein
MGYVGQLDGLRRFQDRYGVSKNVRTLAVFSDGVVVCAVGIEGGFLPNGALLFRSITRGGQRGLRGHREEDVRKSAQSLGEEGSAPTFANSRRKAHAIAFSQMTRVELTSTRSGRTLAIYTNHPRKPDTELVNAYVCNHVSPDDVRRLFEPFVHDRLRIAPDTESS